MKSIWKDLLFGAFLMVACSQAAHAEKPQQPNRKPASSEEKKDIIWTKLTNPQEHFDSEVGYSMFDKEFGVACYYDVQRRPITCVKVR